MSYLKNVTESGLVVTGQGLYITIGGTADISVAID